MRTTTMLATVALLIALMAAPASAVLPPAGSEIELLDLGYNCVGDSAALSLDNEGVELPSGVRFYERTVRVYPQGFGGPSSVVYQEFKVVPPRRTLDWPELDLPTFCP